ncbi:MAG: UDP-glucose--hexose-1-phosphate uridylyltransferase [Streptococcaceae bacterium]|nr:UDP-glucose--hexose-1-phosphate uridylyltransferase [Streptococcaceae bacterium]
MAITEAFVGLAIQSGAYQALDGLYLTNQLRRLVGQDDLSTVTIETSDLYTVIDTLTRVVESNGHLAKLGWTTEIWQAALCDYLTPLPSALNRQFAENYQLSPERATTAFYQSSCDNDYIKVRQIAKNIVFKHPSQYGDMTISINLSKPEKDPKEIAAAKLAPQADFPKCQLCMENEGYLGRLNHPARTNHRIIRFDLVGENWGFQYSPYAYYREHAIFLNEVHQPMVIDSATIDKILRVVSKFPHYFVGSNADLSIVGGSILAHEHFQGGGEQLPMSFAEIEKKIVLLKFPAVQAGILKWPMSVIRLMSTSIEELVAASEHILQVWDNYSDEAVDVLAHSRDGERHHTITPIARRRDGVYELDLVLRDNHTTAAYPDGVFHPHQDVQHIKKENIGLIEVMGLAILPARLKDELEVVKAYVLGQAVKVADYHQRWADELKQDFSGADIDGYLNTAVGQKFERVLEDAGVFKRDAEGRLAFERFIEVL